MEYKHFQVKIHILKSKSWSNLKTFFSSNGKNLSWVFRHPHIYIYKLLSDKLKKKSGMTEIIKEKANSKLDERVNPIAWRSKKLKENLKTLMLS